MGKKKLFFSSFSHDTTVVDMTMELIDTDNSGLVEWQELAIWAVWAVQNHPRLCESVDGILKCIYTKQMLPMLGRRCYEERQEAFDDTTPPLSVAKEPDAPGEPIKAVGSTLLSTMNVKGRHAFLMLYAPWCPHCVAALPEYKQAAEEAHRKYGSRVAFVQMDTSKNQSSRPFEVFGVPTVYWQRAGHAPLAWREMVSVEALLGKIEQVINLE